MTNTKISSLLVVLCLIFAAVFVLITGLRDSVSVLETGLFQIIILFCGLTGSYIFGKNTARESANDLIKPHARSAFRRVLSLSLSLSRLASKIQEYKTACTDATANHCFDKLENMVIEQISTASDTLEDWKDIVPADVEAILEEKKGSKNE